MAAKILHIVNSSFFGLRREITSPAQAVTLLGLETVRVLVLAAGIFSQYQGSGASCVSLEALRVHSVMASGLAREIARLEGADARTVDHAGTAGLLHDVGKLIMLDSGEEDYRAVHAQVTKLGQPSWKIEREIFGASHAEVGACLLGLWGLPVPVVEAVAWHHNPSESPVVAFGPLTAVHVADVLTENGDALSSMDVAHLERLKLGERVLVWTELARSRQAKGAKA